MSRACSASPLYLPSLSSRLRRAMSGGAYKRVPAGRTRPLDNSSLSFSTKTTNKTTTNKTTTTKNIHIHMSPAMPEHVHFPASFIGALLMKTTMNRTITRFFREEIGEALSNNRQCILNPASLSSNHREEGPRSRPARPCCETLAQDRPRDLLL